MQFGNGMQLECRTQYPYGMEVEYSVKGKGRLAVRIPGWSERYSLRVNGQTCAQPPQSGYVYIDVCGQAQVQLVLDGAPAFVRASSRVPRLAGMTALMRGPLVYCFEGKDNGCVRALRIDRSVPPEAGAFDASLLGGIVPIRVQAVRMQDCGSLYARGEETCEPCTATAVPYYTWANRGENEMRVWMNVYR